MVNIPKRSISPFETSPSSQSFTIETRIPGFYRSRRHKIALPGIYYSKGLAMETDFPPLNESQPACGGLAGDHIKYEGLNLILMPPNASRLVVSSPVP